MELKEAIMRRRSLRDFSAQPVPRELVEEALNIPPALEVAALIPFGYKAATAKQFPQTEVRLSERLHTDGW